jgi:NADPH-dependent 2,4-dienoyl-CoA reductase/sulfur reductase-like enzyme
MKPYSLIIRSAGSAGLQSNPPDVLVVGSGPAGLSAAIELADLERGLRILVIDRDQKPGGLPQYAPHPGFGWEYALRPHLTGPKFASLMLSKANKRDNLAILPKTALLSLSGGSEAEILSRELGLARIAPKAVLLATGIREDPGGPRLIGGPRPPLAVMTTGALQKRLTEGLGLTSVGSNSGARLRAVIAGTETVSFSAWLTAWRLGLKTAAFVEERSKLQTWGWVALGQATVLPKIILNAGVTEALGSADKLEGVKILDSSGRESEIACDLLILTGGWKGETQVASQSGLSVKPGPLTLSVDQYFRASADGVFGCGNALLAVRTSGRCAIEGQAAARCLSLHLSGRLPAAEVRLKAGAGVRDLAPEGLGPEGEERLGLKNVLIGAANDMSRARLEIRGDGGELLIDRALGGVKASSVISAPLGEVRRACGRFREVTVSLAETARGQGA